MKKSLLYLFCGIISCSANAQTQIENGGFEGAWETTGVSGSEAEPAEWSSLKSADALASLAPIVAFQETNSPHSGTYCLRLTCVDVFGVVANGIITNGRVHADFDPELGYVFTDPGTPDWELLMNGDKPDSLVGWYKFAPQSGDKAKFEMILHDTIGGLMGKLPETGSTSHWVARARYEITTPTSVWTRFSVPFLYYNSNSPTYGLLVINAGDSTIAVAGTELIVDDLELIYNSSTNSISEETLNDNIDFTIFSYAKNIEINLNYLENTEFRLFSIDGKEVYSTLINDNTSIHHIESDKGIYIYRVVTGGKTFTGKITL